MIGGWQGGSLTPQMPPSLLLTTALTATPAAKSAARLTVVKLLIAKNIPIHQLTQSRSSRRSLITEGRTSKGDHCSRVCVPPPRPFLRLSEFLGSEEAKNVATELQPRPVVRRQLLDEQTS